MAREQKRTVLDLFVNPQDFDIALDVEGEHYVNLGRNCTKGKASAEAVIFRYSTKGEEYLIILPTTEFYADNFSYHQITFEGAQSYSKIEKGLRRVRSRRTIAQHFQVQAIVVTTPKLRSLEMFIDTASKSKVLGLHSKIDVLRQLVESGRVKLCNLDNLEIKVDAKGDLYIYNNLINNPTENLSCADYFGSIRLRIEQRCGVVPNIGRRDYDAVDDEMEIPIFELRETAEKLLHPTKRTTLRQLHARSQKHFEGRAPIYRNGKIGMSDEEGRHIIKPQYDEIFYNHKLMLIGGYTKGEEWVLHDYSGGRIDADKQTVEKVISHEDNYFYIK